MKKSKLKNVELARCVRNDGQIEWLPTNPRQCTKEDLELTKKSIAEDEDFLEDRPVLVTPDGDVFVVFGGNLRMTAAKELGMKTIPAVIYTPESDDDFETIKRRAIKDNGSYGAWDYDILANEWDDLDLGGFGVAAWKTPEFAPNLHPVDGAAPVTDEDIKEAGDHMQDEVTPTPPQVIDVVCPHCGKTFKLKL